MPITHRIDADLGVVYLHIVGHVAPPELSGFLRTLFAEPAYKAGFHFLADCRDGGEANSSEEVRMMADSMRRHGARMTGARCAIVVRTDVQYGLTRIFAAFVGDAPFELQTFRKLEDACRWLGESVGRPVSPP